MMQACLAEESVIARRLTFAALFVVTLAASLWLAVIALAPGGFGILDLAALVLFAATLPWMVAGFWNAVIGFIIMRFAADPAMAVLPSSARNRLPSGAQLPRSRPHSEPGPPCKTQSPCT